MVKSRDAVRRSCGRARFGKVPVVTQEEGTRVAFGRDYAYRKRLFDNGDRSVQTAGCDKPDVKVTERDFKVTETIGKSVVAVRVFNNAHTRYMMKAWAKRVGCTVSEKPVQEVGKEAYYLVYGDSASIKMEVWALEVIESWKAPPGNGMEYRRILDSMKQSHKRVIQRGGKVAYTRNRGNQYVP